MSQQPYLGFAASGWYGANAAGNLPQTLPLVIARGAFPALAIAGPPSQPFAPSNPAYWTSSDAPIGVNLAAPAWLRA